MLRRRKKGDEVQHSVTSRGINVPISNNSPYAGDIWYRLDRGDQVREEEETPPQEDGGGRLAHRLCIPSHTSAPSLRRDGEQAPSQTLHLGK